MPLLLAPDREPLELRDRLTRLRRSWRLLLVAQGACIVAAGLLFVITGIGVLDRVFQLPAILRAAALVSLLVAVSLFIWRRIARPLREIGDDVALALRVEEHFPTLNDALASTVQFEQHSLGSADLRRATRRFAIREAEECNFGELLDYRPARRAVVALAVIGSLAAVLAVTQLQAARLAVLRLIDPFGEHPWPPQTTLEIEAPDWLPRGDPFVLRGRLAGVIPERAQFRFALEGSPSSEQPIAVSPQGDGGILVVRLEPNRVPKSFRYQVRANDAESPWRTVPVLVPPQLTPLDGRPSPQIHLDFPSYTALPPRDLPDGGNVVDCITGSTVRIRAATDRPIVAASIQLAADPPQSMMAGGMTVLASTCGIEAIGYSAARETVTSCNPATIGHDGRAIEIAFRPHVTGMYLLRFGDGSGLSGYRLLDIRLQLDPPPTVSLDRPSLGRDLLHVLPNATLPLVAQIDDPRFAVHSAWLTYRCGKGEKRQRMQMWDAEVIPTNSPVRTSHVAIDRRLELRHIHHTDGRPLSVGDTVTLTVEADDFDDVTIPKPPGSSHEVVLHIVGASDLLSEIHKAEAEIERELKELLQIQRDALVRTTAADAIRRQSGALTPEAVDRLLQAEQMQQQLRGRLGNSHEGLQGKAERLRSNSLPKNPDRDRIEMLAAELDRIAREELPQIEPLLSQGRRSDNAGGALPRAMAHQLEVERSLQQLLDHVQPGSDVRNLRLEASSLLRDQERVSRELSDLEQPGAVGQPRSQLSAEHRQQLDRLAERQSALADRSNELLGKLTQALNEKQSAAANNDNAAVQREIKALAAAREALRHDQKNSTPPSSDASLAARQKEAAESIGRNELGRARQAQETAERMLKQAQESLQESAGSEADLLAKKRKLDEAASELEQLLQEQEQLQKRANEAAKISDPDQRRQELQQLAREQEKLQQRARDLAQRLTRERGELAARELRQAARTMDQARERMERGEPAEDKQDDALDRLDDAQLELSRARQGLEEELQRDRQDKLRDGLRMLKERQESLSAESERLFEAVKKNGGWTRALQASLGNLADAEAAIGGEITQIAEKQLKDAAVMAYIARLAVESLKELSANVDAVRSGPLDLESWDSDRKAIQSPQQSALKRLTQLFEAIDEAARSQSQRGQPPDGQPAEPSQRRSDGVSPLAQLKLVRSLQTEIMERTAAFAQAHPDLEKLTAEQAAELAAIQRAQREVTALAEELIPAEHPKRDPSGEKP